MLLPQSNSFDALNSRIRSVKFITKIDDDDEDDDLYENKKDIDEELSQENKKAIIDKYINILKEKYNEKKEYEKTKKKKIK